MGRRFGIIAEGVTDQKVLEAILAGYFEDDDDLDVTYIQPIAAAAAPAVGNAGWGMVFKEFETGRFAEALDGDLRDYLVVQIDTDVSEQAGYGVSWRDDGRELTPAELVDRVIAKLRQVAGAARFDALRDRLIFAVSVHSIECWLLPLFYTDKKRSKITGCLDAMNVALKRADVVPLSNSAGEKSPRAYEAASRGFEKRRGLLRACAHNASFEMFVRALDERFPPPLL